MRLYVGTSGYSYKEWKGTFYPEKLKNDHMLKHYGTKLNSVEINSSFYRMPRRSTLEKWAGEVPDGFRFVLKASRRITHERMLKGADDTVDYLFELSESLGVKLGPILFQLHPRLRCDVDLLARFLDLLPEGRLVAFELKHRSWSENPKVPELLRARNAATVWVHNDGDSPEPPSCLPSTASWGYARLRSGEYTVEDLVAWQRAFEQAGWQEVYTYFKHEEEMTGPEFAVRMLGLQSSR